MQMMHYLLVTGKKKGYLAVLIGNQDFKWRVVERDEKLLNEILKREVEFWNEYVVKNERPSMVTKNDGETLSRLFPTADPEKEIMLGDEANVLVENLQALKADEKHLGGLIDQVENQLKVLLEDATVGRTSINEIRWANVPSNKFDTGLFKEKEPKMYSEYLRSKIIRRFSAKAIKAPKEN
jgi:predicted phage-related endonuclease